MYMIGHYLMNVQRRTRKMTGYFQPESIGQFANIIQVHYSIVNFTKIMFPVFGTNGYKICAIPGIIPPLGTGGFAAVFTKVFVGHTIEG
jgi:hypothetical protein